MRLFPWFVMLCAAFAAGVVNAIAGGGTLLTFPVLIWLGLDPRVANGTSTVALWPGLFGGLFGYRRDIENSSTILFRLGVTSIIGGAVGALLLIRTPSRVFANLVPFLILFATILFMSHGVINRRFRRTILKPPPVQLLGSIYDDEKPAFLVAGFPPTAIFTRRWAITTTSSPRRKSSGSVALSPPV